MVLWFSPLHNIIKQSQQGFALIKTLLAVCRRFTIMKNPENVFGWNKASAHYRNQKKVSGNNVTYIYCNVM